MSRFLLPSLQGLDPYVPGEQPQNRQYVKLNTNENPYPPSPKVIEALNAAEVEKLNLYSDPTSMPLKRAIAAHYGLKADQVFCGNGSDEVLAFSFMAYADAAHPVTMPEVSYGFYKVFANLFHAKPVIVPLNDDFTLPFETFCHADSLVVFANPNAPTGLSLPLDNIEAILKSNPDHIVIVDEAYVDFGSESALPLLKQYDNLLIVRTFSKSRSLAGGRLGYAMGSPSVIADLERVRNSFHPYNINRLTMLAGIEAMKDKAYFESCTKKIIVQRSETASELRSLGFTMTDSLCNFLFVRHPKLTAREYYENLKARGVLIRCWDDPNLKEHARITIGTRQQMRRLVLETRAILAERI